MTTATEARTEQLNARIEADLKQRGNRGLLRAGYTPARAIRQLWALAAEHEHEPEFIESLLSGNVEGQSGEDQDAERRTNALHFGWSIVDHMSAAAEKDADNTNYGRLEEQAASEKLAAYDDMTREVLS